MARLTHFECTKCGAIISAGQPRTVCPQDGGVLFARYDLKSLKQDFKPSSLAGRMATMWRYADVLPQASPVTLGEGFTPLLASRTVPGLFIKEEGVNPTGSFKARGLAAAVTMARAFGLTKLAIPTAGNAGSALAAYASAGGLEAHVFMPMDVPEANKVECESFGARVTLVDGLIGDCARMVAERAEREGWFDVSTLKEPFRVEGKKTMGYEVAEQLGWKLPQSIIYPCGGGVGLIGMWKAFDEMEELGWIGPERPRMIAAQASGCAPIVKAFHEGKATAEPWPDASTVAAGLRVPRPYGDYLILDILKKSRGVAVAVGDEEIMEALTHWARVEGLFASPEGAAALAAYRKLRGRGFFAAGEMVVLFNTGSGLKYLDVITDWGKRDKLPGVRHMGGIIGPY
ncbi:MAG TPA: threonine synthase [Terriglobales bacterium]|nr:threonine synthase [Terriglobales bacterium]